MGREALKQWAPLLFVVIFSVVSLFAVRHWQSHNTGAPPYGESEPPPAVEGSYDWVKNWKRPEGPTRVGLQVGHWKNEELPAELSRLHGNTGTSGGGKTEIEVNHAIAEGVAKYLRERGVLVDILPATVPPDYWADAFVAIHADGSTDSSASGFKMAAPWRDLTGKSNQLADQLEQTYELATDLPKDPNITRNMRGYYAFAWWRYEHSIHPMTPATIVETGFLTSAKDRRLIVNQSDVAAQAIAEGIYQFLRRDGLV